MLAQQLDLEKLQSKDPKVKYGFAKTLLQMGKDMPEILYPYFSQWKDMLASENKILKWTAIDIIGYISAVDDANRIDPLVPTLFGFLHIGQLIICNHSIFALSLIAKNKAVMRDQIILELLKINHDSFDSPDCREIARGKVILSLHDFVDQIDDLPEVMAFIQGVAESKRPATRKKAEKLLKKLARSNC